MLATYTLINPYGFLLSSRSAQILKADSWVWVLKRGSLFLRLSRTLELRQKLFAVSWQRTSFLSVLASSVQIISNMNPSLTPQEKRRGLV